LPLRYAIDASDSTTDRPHASADDDRAMSVSARMGVMVAQLCFRGAAALLPCSTSFCSCLSSAHTPLAQDASIKRRFANAAHSLAHASVTSDSPARQQRKRIRAQQRVALPQSRPPRSASPGWPAQPARWHEARCDPAAPTCRRPAGKAVIIDASQAQGFSCSPRSWLQSRGSGRQERSASSEYTSCR